MFINLTNHPSSEWGMIQKNAAIEQYGNIIDLPFPAVAPDWSELMIQERADEYFHKCVELIGVEKSGSAVHLAGELSFCFYLAQLLLHEGYTCVTSTTKRIVETHGNVKKSTFQFCCFRKLSLL